MLFWYECASTTPFCVCMNVIGRSKKFFMYRRHITISLRAGIAFFAVIASLGFAFFMLNGSHNVTHAAAATPNEINLPGVDPWGLGFDRQGNLWVAEPGCDPNPVCATVNTGSIAQVNRSSFSVFNNFVEPTGYSSPLFIAVDDFNNIWFSEPMTNAIGELTVSNGAPTWKQWTVPTANATPFDLAFDQYGHLWFTEILANQIGEFDPSTQTFVETPTPTANSKPYGIVGPDPTTGAMWFTENNSSVAQIASFIPPSSGNLATSAINEYQINAGNVGATPHLITFDGNGNIWWSEGPDRNIGRLVISQAKPGTSNGVQEFTVPYPDPNCPAATDCSMHISGIGVDGAGNVWFDDSLSSRVGYYAQSTGTFTMLPPIGGAITSNTHPHDGLAVDGNNTVFFAEEFANKLGEVLQPTVPLPPAGSTGTPITPTPSVTPSPTSTPIPTSPFPGPVNKTWYFAEGRVGKGFQEFLTIDNPGTTMCNVDLEYNYTMDGSSEPLNKTVRVPVASASRITESVNGDLHILSSTVPAAIVATVASVDSSTASCPGVVVERPMYFQTFKGIASGSDVVGATHLSTTYYFADIPTGSDTASFITLLNPNNVSANVSVSYYANGQKVGTQSTTVSADARGTITPNLIAMPLHVAAVVTSSQPIMAERPTYFINGGTSGNAAVSGGYDVVGISSLAKDWLFAEGYTGGTTQEYFTLANVDPSNTTANVTITLKSQGGVTHAFTLSLNAMSQIIWNVNANNTFANSTPQVSAEITSTGANIVVQREMYFQYKHSLPNGRVTQAVGGTDVIGQVGPAKYSAYSFAEGYSNVGYNEWLTVQNPNPTPVTIYVVMANGYGRTYTVSFPVPANSRFTQDLTALVVQYLVHNGDDHRGYEVSMTVETLDGSPITVERPMYWNTSGSSFATQGGSDVIGYVGG